MRKINCYILLIFLSIVSVGISEDIKRPSRKHIIHFENTPNELNVYKLYGRFDGNTVFILGGIQGDEPGGFMSADLYPNLQLETGNLIVVPRANFHSIIRNERGIGINGDMNRRFDTDTPKDIEGQIVEIIKKLMAESDLFLNLHDGWGFYSDVWIDDMRNPKRFGQSVIADASTYITETDVLGLESMAREVISKVNKKIEDESHYFHFMNTNTLAPDTEFPEQLKSATCYALTQFGIPAFGIESSKNLKNLELKIRYHNYVINEFLELVEVEPEHPAIIYEPPQLIYLLISVNKNDPRLVDNNGTIHLFAGDEIKVTHIESNYERGLSCDIIGVGTEQDFQKTVVLDKSTSIIVKKDSKIIGKISINVDTLNCELMTYILEVNGKNKAILHRQTLRIKRGDKIRIRNVVLEGISSSQVKVNLKGYVPPLSYNTGEDRNYLIDASKLNWEKYSIYGKGKVYPIVVLKGEKEISRAFIYIKG